MNHVIGLSDMRVSRDPNDTLVTYSLGSCIGISLYDPSTQVGGILHFMLPDSGLDGTKARKNPFIFADTGIQALLEAATGLGGDKTRMSAIIAGGAQILDEYELFNIGKKNYLAAKKQLAEHHVKTKHEDVGGKINRTVTLSIQTGHTFIATPGMGKRRV